MQNFEMVGCDLSKQRESPIVTPWVGLLSLPINYFAPACLEGIGKAISKLVCLDGVTSNKHNTSFARICVELDLTMPIPQKVWIGTSLDKDFWPKIVVEGNTTHCGLHGRMQSYCRRLKNNAMNTSDTTKNTTRKFCSRC